MEAKKHPARSQSSGEEIANSLSHGVGLLGALAATPILIVVACRQDSATAIVASCVFGASMISLYLMSTLYHALPQNRAKRVFNILDHCAIYFLIAGTYTPFTLVVLGGGWGWSLFGIVWGLAVVGIAFKAFGRMGPQFLSAMLYVAMGWIALIAIKPLWNQLPSSSMVWLVAGGVAYTLGVPFYATDRRRYNHFIWHLFVLTGTTCHFIAVLKCAT